MFSGGIFSGGGYMAEGYEGGYVPMEDFSWGGVFHEGGTRFPSII